MTFATEAEMVAAWLQTDFARSNHRGLWTAYPETAGWDLLIAHKDGYQIGVEAKLSLNPKVIEQALVGQHDAWRAVGPDYRAVMVPSGKCQKHMERIANAIGLHILLADPPGTRGWTSLQLPNEDRAYHAWPNWMPEKRCALPDYVPDVTAGVSGPVMLTPWKVKAIKLMLILERRGYVTRADMRALEISPTRWCDHYAGFLTPGPGRGYLRCDRTPDLKAQHPINWGQIEADMPTWAANIDMTPPAEPLI